MPVTRPFAQLKSGLRWLTGTRQKRRHGLVGPRQLWQMKRDSQFEFLTTNGLLPAHYLLDLGCGTLRGGIPLIRQLDAGHYYGVDVRSETIDEAWKELAESGLESKQPVLRHVPDPDGVDLGRRFDFVWAFSVLIHMTDDALRGSLDFVARHLLETGTFYANVNVGAGAEEAWQGFPVVRRSPEFYEQAADAVGLQCRRVGVLADLGHVSGSKAQDEQTMLSFTTR